MEKEISKSRLLRRKLLTALITCLLTVIIMCTAIFNITYNQTAKTVIHHSNELAEDTVSIISDSVYQHDLSAMQNVLRNFCNETSLEMRAYGYFPSQENEFISYVNQKAASYFNYHFFESCVFFVMTDDEISGFVIENGNDGESYISEALTAFDQKAASDTDFYGDASVYLSYMNEYRKNATGDFMKDGSGYMIAWDNMINFTDTELCVGIVKCQANSAVDPIKTLASEEASTLIDNMDILFKKYIYIMVASLFSIFIVFIIVSAILAKKLADPVVSEHDMLVKVNEMKTAFLSDASHELKTPLAAMSGYAQNAEIELSSGCDTKSVQEKLKRISSEANRMALMVTQILDATRIEEGRMVLELSPCDLDKLVRETVETYFAVLNKNNNRLALRIPLELPVVEADASRLKRVFVNLISNALKHTHNGTILVKAGEEEGFIKVTVKDTGCGISPEDMPHIWERYYKGKHSETGTGLGLFICKFIIESHGGKIWAESEVGKGTEFIFTLPLKKDNKNEL
ncbi:MAG: HAMP domain-containing histidine kinase [Ruminococcus sp.]|nr:HAMP domain-containing histidine kinase [Ruminococcus sp.]